MDGSAELDVVRRDSAPALKTICFCINEFKRGPSCIKDEARFGRPVEVTTKDIIERIYGILMDGRRVKIREINETVGILNERVHNILHEKLLCSRLLTADQSALERRFQCSV